MFPHLFSLRSSGRRTAGGELTRAVWRPPSAYFVAALPGSSALSLFFAVLAAGPAARRLRPAACCSDYRDPCLSHIGVARPRFWCGVVSATASGVPHAQTPPPASRPPTPCPPVFPDFFPGSRCRGLPLRWHPPALFPSPPRRLDARCLEHVWPYLV